MKKINLKFTYINGPTALIEINGFRLLTDPTFDPAGEEYKTSIYTLKKISSPALMPEELGNIDAVLLSHDHHFDNLDHKGRQFLSKVKLVLTTEAGAERLGGNAVGLPIWESFELADSENNVLKITGTPARHGPVDGDRGPVTGFILSLSNAPQNNIYISGDTVWYEGVEEVSKRFNVKVAVLFMGAARLIEVRPEPLTFTAEEAVKAAYSFKDSFIVPLHFEGWKHFSESRSQIVEAFTKAGLEKRLLWLEPNSPQELII